MQTKIIIECPLCKEGIEKLLYRYHIESERQVIERIKKENPQWTERDGICSRCIDHYHVQVVIGQRMLPEIGPHFPVKSADDFVILPTPLRLGADPGYTGKGVTICFIDSGFYLHDDLIKTRNRVKKVIDITDPSRTDSFFKQPHPSAWHGTMTSVVCAGDGYSSNGLYKGIAPDVELVLIKVQNEENKITTENIVKALEWVLKNHSQYNIRIINMSLGGDEDVSYHQSVIDQLVEQLIDEGIAIVAAVGNDEYASIKPPANAQNVISVGGIDDNNFLDNELSAYHSSFGLTIDGLFKPELVANAIWIAAPILPGTKEKEEAELLNRAFSSTNESLIKEWPVLQKKIPTTLENGQIIDVTFIRKILAERIQLTKFFSPHYMHVDGTSFAAPIVCAVIAQMLEIEPALDPASIRRVLFSTAKRLPLITPEKQGFGYIRPRHALLQIIKKEVIMKPHESPYLNKRKKMIEFFIEHDFAQQISLAGSFNHWAQDVLLMEPGRKGMWKIEIPMLPNGTYRYKFFIDDKMWVEDVENPLREPDGFNGWNSLLVV
ncbi:MAG: S8 family serine peptidase [Chitinophagaceae bacterium]